MLIALFGALAIGLTLGLLGSGGSILTVPVLVYLVDEPEKVAIAESLGIVAMISLVGALPYAFEKKIHWRSVLLFGVPGMAGTYLGAFLSQYMPGSVQLLIFAGVMMVAAVLMMRDKKPGAVDSAASPADPSAANGAAPHAEEHRDDSGEGGIAVAAPAQAKVASAASGDAPKKRKAWKIMIDGLVVGVLTGLVGVGGGFLIVPALVILGGLSMRIAIGTSLLIIALKSFTGLYKYWDVLGEAGLTLDWQLIGIFGAIGIVGSFVGSRMGAYVPQAKLKRGFAVFLVVMGIYIIWQNAGALL